MKKILLLLLFAITYYQIHAGFHYHSYFVSQEPQGGYNFFVVVTYDNGDGYGEVYMASGFVHLGDCPIMVTPDRGCILSLEDAISTPEVHAQFSAMLISRGIDPGLLPPVHQISVFCNPSAGFIIVGRSKGLVDKVEIRDTFGTLLKAFPSDPNSTSEKYDISDLHPGVYIVACGKNQVTIHTDQVIKN